MSFTHDNPFGEDSLLIQDQNSTKRIGNRIREIREAKGLTQSELGKAVGLNADRIQKYENGFRTPKIELLLKIADALGVNSLALADPVTQSQIGSIFAMFELKKYFNLQIEKSSDGFSTKYSLVCSSQSPLFGEMQDWYLTDSKVMDDLKAASSTEEKDKIIKEYNMWQWSYPQGIIEATKKETEITYLKDKIEELQKKYDKLIEEKNS